MAEIDVEARVGDIIQLTDPDTGKMYKFDATVLMQELNNPENDQFDRERLWQQMLVDMKDIPQPQFEDRGKTLIYRPDANGKWNFVWSSIASQDTIDIFEEALNVIDLRATQLIVDNIEALRNITVPYLPAGRILQVQVLGYHVPFDGGGGSFYWQYNNNQIDDDGLVFKPNSIVGAGRFLRVRYDDEINLRWFGAKGDGTPESNINAQKAFDALTRRTIVVPDGARFVWNTNGPTVRSNTVVKSTTGIIEQSIYDDNSTSTVGDEYSGLRFDLGFENIALIGLDIRGPFYNSTVTPSYRSIGISASGRYDQYFYNNPNYPANPPVAVSGVSNNLTLLNLKVNGFGQSGMILDNINNVSATLIEVSHCCRDSIRCYGVEDGQFDKIYSKTLGPGMPAEGIPPNNNAYGVEFTRIYHSTLGDGSLTDYRISRRCTVSNSKSQDIPSWKAFGTHGGQDISFLYCEWDDCHIGIGVDKGGFTAGDGYAPPRRINIIGCRARYTKGTAFGYRCALFLVADNDDDLNIGEDLYISDFHCTGPWGDELGEDSRDGAIVISNYRRVNLNGFLITGAFGSAISLQNTVTEFSIYDGNISNVAPQENGNCVGINCQGSKLDGDISGINFYQNPLMSPMTALSSATQPSGYGVRIDSDIKFKGNIVKFNSSGVNFLEDSPYFHRSFGWANYNMAGGTVPTISVAKGIASLSLIATGQVRVTMREAATSSQSYKVSAIPKATADIRVTVNPISTTEFDVYSKNAAGVAINSAMYLDIIGY